MSLLLKDSSSVNIIGSLFTSYFLTTCAWAYIQWCTSLSMPMPKLHWQTCWTLQWNTQDCHESCLKDRLFHLGVGGVQICESPLNLTMLIICYTSEAPKKGNSYSFRACSSFNFDQGSNQHPVLPRYFPTGDVVSYHQPNTMNSLIPELLPDGKVYLSNKIVRSNYLLRTLTFQQSHWETQVYYQIIINSCGFGCSGTWWTLWIFFL